MITAILRAFGGVMDAVNAWLKGLERKELREAGMNQQKVTDHEAKEKARYEKRLRDDHIRNNPDISERLREHFHNPDSG